MWTKKKNIRGRNEKKRNEGKLQMLCCFSCSCVTTFLLGQPIRASEAWWEGVTSAREINVKVTLKLIYDEDFWFIVDLETQLED